jgi:hypothetical protein
MVLYLSDRLTALLHGREVPMDKRPNQRPADGDDLLTWMRRVEEWTDAINLIGPRSVGPSALEA